MSFENFARCPASEQRSARTIYGVLGTWIIEYWAQPFFRIVLIVAWHVSGKLKKIQSDPPPLKTWVQFVLNKLCGKNGEVCYFEIECSHALSSIGRVTRLSLSQSRWIYRRISCAGRVHTIKWSSMCIENSKNRTTFRVPLNELVAQPTSINFADSKVISSNQVNKHTDTMPFDTLRIDSFGSVGDLESDWLRHTFPILSTLCDCVWTLKVWSQWPDFFCN